jgi:hypothetical protein
MGVSTNTLGNAMAFTKRTWFVPLVFLTVVVLLVASNAKYRHEFESCAESWMESETRWAMREVELVQRAKRDLKNGDTELAEKYLEIRYDAQVKVLKLAAECNEVTEEICEQASEMLARVEECSSLEDNQESGEE